MSECDKTLAAVCAALLDTVTMIFGFQCLVFIGNIVVVLKQPGGLLGAITVILMLCVTYCCIRLALDAKIFRAFSEKQYSLSEFDQALMVLFNRLPTPTHTKLRDMANRCHGAVRLYRALVIVSVLHTALLFIRLV